MQTDVSRETSVLISLPNSYHNVGAAQNKITYLFIQTILFIYLTFIYPNILLSTDISRLHRLLDVIRVVIP